MLTMPSTSVFSTVRKSCLDLAKSIAAFLDMFAGNCARCWTVSASFFSQFIFQRRCVCGSSRCKARDWWGNKKEFNVGKLYEILDLGSPGRHPVPLLSFYCYESQRCTKRRKGAKWWKYIIIKKNIGSDENDMVKWSSFFGCRKARIKTLRPITEATL